MRVLFLVVFLLFSTGTLAPAQPKTEKVVAKPALLATKNCVSEVPPQLQKGLKIQFLNQMEKVEQGFKYTMTFVPPLIVAELDKECLHARVRILEPFKEILIIDRFQIVTVLGSVQYQIRELRESMVTKLVTEMLNGVYGVQLSPYVTAQELQMRIVPGIPLCPCQPAPAQPPQQNKNSL